MLSLLTLTMSLRKPLAHERRIARRRRAEDDDRTVSLIKSEVTRGLIGEALLQADDLPSGWVQDCDTGESLFSGTEFEPLFMSEMRVRFYRPDTAEYLDQHVGILPRWAVSHFEGELARATVHTGFGGRASAAHVIDIPPLGDQALALRLPAGAADPAPLSVDAVFLRRGVFVMALASWHPDPRRLDAGRTAYLAILADRKWAPVASALN